jgi:hypothetical protein
MARPRKHDGVFSEERNPKSGGCSIATARAEADASENHYLSYRLAPMKKEDVDLDNQTMWIPDSKTDCGVAEAPLTQIAVEAFRSQIEIAGSSPFLFPNPGNSSGY